MDTILLYSVPAIALLGLLIMAIQAAWVRKQDAGESKMAEIAQHIHEGALAFLNAEYRILAIFVVVAGALLGFVSTIVETTEIYIVAAFVIGACFLSPRRQHRHAHRDTSECSHHASSPHRHCTRTESKLHRRHCHGTGRCRFGCFWIEHALHPSFPNEKWW